MLNAGSLNDAFATHIRIIKKKYIVGINRQSEHQRHYSNSPSSSAKP